MALELDGFRQLLLCGIAMDSFLLRQVRIHRRECLHLVDASTYGLRECFAAQLLVYLLLSQNLDHSGHLQWAHPLCRDSAVESWD